MALSNLEENEIIIQQLEELDSTFSNIKGTLRDIKMKLSNLSATSKQIADDCTPWIRFFKAEPVHEISPLSELQLNSLKFKQYSDSPDIMNISTPKNPFMDLNSSDLLNKSLVKGYKSTLVADSSSIPSLNKSKLYNYESTHILESEENNDNIPKLVPFDYSQLPEIFQQEAHLKDLYDFIKLKKTVCVEEICKNFSEISAEKLNIFITLLCRKNFIKQKNGNLTIENK